MLTSLRTLLVASLLIQASFAQAQGVPAQYQTEGDVVTLSGKLDGWRDRETLWRHIKGKRVLILRQVTATGVDSAFLLAKVVRQARITTVMDGDCDALCLMIFMGGESRQWGQRPYASPSVATFANPPEGNSLSVAPTYFSYFQERFSAMPMSTLNFYIYKRTASNGIRFVQPNAAYPEGLAADCENYRQPDRCVQNPALLPYRVGLITTPDPYPLQPTEAAQTAPALPPTSSSLVQTPIAAPPTAAPAQQSATQIKAGTVVTARSVSEIDGPTGIASSFNLEGRIFSFASFSWPVDQVGGSHVLETRWYRGSDLVHRSPRGQVSWKETPGSASYAVRAADLGVGQFKVEIWLDDKLVGSRNFTIREE